MDNSWGARVAVLLQLEVCCSMHPPSRASLCCTCSSSLPQLARSIRSGESCIGEDVVEVMLTTRQPERSSGRCCEGLGTGGRGAQWLCPVSCCGPLPPSRGAGVANHQLSVNSVGLRQSLSGSANLVGFHGRATAHSTRYEQHRGRHMLTLYRV